MKFLNQIFQTFNGQIFIYDTLHIVLRMATIFIMHIYF